LGDRPPPPPGVAAVHSVDGGLNLLVGRVRDLLDQVAGRRVGECVHRGVSLRSLRHRPGVSLSGGLNTVYSHRCWASSSSPAEPVTACRLVTPDLSADLCGRLREAFLTADYTADGV